MLLAAAAAAATAPATGVTGEAARSGTSITDVSVWAPAKFFRNLSSRVCAESQSIITAAKNLTLQP
jgi:hypothetical protein